MAMVIGNGEQLAAWLADQPDGVSRVVALRIALRAFPLAIDRTRFVNNRMHERLLRVMVRSLVVSWFRLASVGAVDGHDLTGAQNAYIAAQEADDRVTAEIACAVSHAASAACAIWDGDAADCGTAAAYNAGIGVSDALGAAAVESFWRAVAADGQRLERGAALSLLLAPLWLDGAPEWFSAMLANADTQPWLAAAGFALWRDWYARRVEGEALGFADAPEQDAAIGQRLMAADDGWWARDSATINAELRSWLA
jgi:hypothetical protein